MLTLKIMTHEMYPPSFKKLPFLSKIYNTDNYKNVT